ncbi:hypothetical protein [Nocardia nova]|uniref:hypothetical protein n=1 Tax=Nocardia nova TaxID=37330 RepID=UPI0033E2D338
MSDRRWRARYWVESWSGDRLSDAASEQIRHRLSDELGFTDVGVTVESRMQVQVAVTVAALTHLDAVRSTNDYVLTAVRTAYPGDIVAIDVRRFTEDSQPATTMPSHQGR